MRRIAAIATDNLCVLQGPSVSSASSPSTQVSTQATSQGAGSPNVTPSGGSTAQVSAGPLITSTYGDVGSTRLTAGGNLTYNDPTITAGLLSQLQQTVNAALTGAGNVVSGYQQQAAAASNSDGGLVASLLASEQQLASTVGTGGANITAGQNTTVIWGVLGVAVAVVLAVLFHRNK